MLKQVHASDLHLLRVFIAVAEERGIAAAQYRLNVAPSTISTQLSHLEDRLGLKLCQRGRAGFSLTDEGRAVLDAAYVLQDDLNEFAGSVSQLKGEAVGEVRIAIIDNLVFQPDLHLHQALRSLRNKYPNINFQLYNMSPDEIETALLAQKVDMGITWVMNQLPSLSRTNLMNETQLIMCGRHHPFFEADDEDISEQMIESTDWVARTYPLPRTFPFSRPHVTSAKAHSMETVAHFILAGTHLGYLPEHYAGRWIQEEQMRIIHKNRFNYQVPLDLAVRTDMLETPVIRICREEILAVHKQA
ncbi:MAG: LysR family transcriptional regulator [Pseudomonadota bacterium]